MAFALGPCRARVWTDDRLPHSPEIPTEKDWRISGLFKDLPSFQRNKVDRSQLHNIISLGRNKGWFKHVDIKHFLPRKTFLLSPSHSRGDKAVLWHSPVPPSMCPQTSGHCRATILEGIKRLRRTDGFLRKRAKLTQIIVALVHLGDVDLCGSLGNLHNAVVAQAGESMLKHTRHDLAACVVASAHPALVHDFVGA